ncbi:MAG: DUF6492 family protein [Alphaproteobacteria bacterium]
MTNKKTTLVLVARATPESMRLLNYVLLPSFLSNWEKVARFIIVCPSKDYSQLAPIAVGLGAELYADEKFTNIEKLEPYRRQVAIKLLVSSIIETPFYLTLDCDCLFLPGGEAAMYDKDGRPFLHTNKSQNYYNRYWLENCDKLTGNIRYTEPMMGFTPQIFIVKHVRDVVAFVENKYNADFISSIMQWDTAYCRATAPLRARIEAMPHTPLKPALVSDALLQIHQSWGEYALYWSYILSCSLENDYSIAQPLCDKYYMGARWASYVAHPIPKLTEEELEFDLLAEGFFHYRSPLAVIQSTAGANWDLIAMVLVRYGLIKAECIVSLPGETSHVCETLEYIRSIKKCNPLLS